jgi:hypothetical protein
LIGLAVFAGNSRREVSHSVLIGLVFLAAFSTLVILMRFEMGRRRFWLAGALVAFAALVVGLMSFIQP